MTEEFCRVLVIDDDRDGADAVVMLLGIWGHEAVAAYSAEDAVRLGCEFDPDVVLVDIGLPGKNGFEVARELKACCPNARFVALTGFTRADIARRAQQDGFAQHLLKPASPPVLKTVIDDQCAASKANTEP